MKIWKTMSALLRFRSWSMGPDSFLKRRVRAISCDQAGHCNFTETLGDRPVGGQRRENAGLGGLEFGCARGDQLGRGDEHPGGRWLEMERLVGGPDGRGTLHKPLGRRQLDT